MGHDHQQSSSSGAVVAIVGVVLIVAILGVLVVAGVGLFFVSTSSVQFVNTSSGQSHVFIEDQMVTQEEVTTQRAVAEVHLAEAEIQQAVSQLQRAATQIRQSSVAATLEASLNFEVSIDREGNASIDGEKIGLDELKARLAKLKAETSNTFSVQINADPECPVKHIIPVLDVCKEVGDIDFSVATSSDSDLSIDEGDAR